jgi:transposase-like protein
MNIVESANATRRDARPEHMVYRDAGCDLHPACLSCPFPRCRYDEFHGAVHLRQESTAQEIERLYLAGAPVGQLCQRFGIARRTVFRYLKQVREQASYPPG